MTLFTPTKTLDLRPYQVTTVEQLREALRQGHRRIILCAPTGSGKTEMAIYLVQEASEKKSRVIFVADPHYPGGPDQPTPLRLRHSPRSSPVEQHPGPEPIQVASAQTIEKRDYWNSLDLLIIDEATSSVRPSWSSPKRGPGRSLG